ncbi:MAG: PEFG-CTERM sorting domain-containing protein [Candidatus Nitrosotenuis sp.]
MIDTLVIKGVAVPEFQEIVLMVLGSSIVLGIVFARKFTII